MLYLNLVWHQHQPLYYKDENGVYTRPWARAHATKDYYDMAALLQDYPGVHVTFNLTPVLIRQLDDLASGAKDYYRVLSEIPAGNLTDDQKRFLLTRFFDANWDHVIARFPRYRELLDKRGPSADPNAIEAALTTFSEQDFRDLQVWWNLAWFDPSFLNVEPLKSLVEKGRNFDEADKATLFAEVDRIVAQVIPLHKQMQDSGQIEVIVTPYAHPILPLLYATDLAAIGDPGALLPERFSYPNDAIAQVQQAVEVYQAHYGRPPRGMWPAEGAVAEEIVKFVADAGFTWMASGEPVLAKSLGMEGFTRDANETVQEADALYRPYYVRFRDGPKVAIVFRDLRLSDLIGFEYSGDSGEAAAQDFLDRLEAIRARLKEEGATGPHLVSVILDGENAWENYDNDGLAFLNALYRKLQASDTIQTITPSEYLARFPDQREIENLWPGAWFSSDYGTWIGEEEEKTAWEYLGRTRKMLADYDIYKKKQAPPDKLAAAFDYMYLAEGSDWFWWYGSDQDSGTDEYFDEAFRALLRGVYQSLDEPVPDFVNVPIIPARAAPPTRPVQDVLSPQVDGQTAPGEWDNAGYFEVRGGSQARAGDALTALYYGYDAGNFYFRLDARQNWEAVGDGVLGLYLGVGSGGPATAFTRFGGTDSLLGYGATALLEITLQNGQPAAVTLSAPDPLGGWLPPAPAEGLRAAAAGNVLEAALPFDAVGQPGPGEQLNLRAVWSEGAPAAARDRQIVPAAGPARTILPDLTQVAFFLEVNDPPGDDDGPGTYTYPTDPVFEPGVYDASAFRAGVDGDEFVFRFDLNGPIHNPWGSGINLSVQTFDIYMDFDPGAGTGARLLLEGRNAALGPQDGWDMAVWVEGWNQKVLVPDENGIPREVSGDNVKVIVDPNGTATIRVRAAAVPELGATPDGWALDPATFGYVALVLSQEGFPAPGVRRIRDVEPVAAQWRMGGAPDDTNHTRIVDLLWPDDQHPILSNYPPSQQPAGQLGPDDFAQIPLLRVP
ncbi:MAG: glycoside hydrolase [Caldilineae bacterium]|nr:MAG: glycoside hydrolase [Caldilineae bacterium]